MTNNTDELNFDDLTPAEIPVRHQGKRYVLREASEDAVRRWRNAGSRGLRMEDGKVVGLDDQGDLNSLLVSLCLFEADEDGSVRASKNGNPVAVPLAVVRSWQGRVVKKMFDWVSEASGLRDDAAGANNGRAGQDAKNGRGATPETSDSHAS